MGLRAEKPRIARLLLFQSVCKLQQPWLKQFFVLGGAADFCEKGEGT